MATTVREAFDEAVRAQQDGRLDVASQWYLRILGAVPNHADALNNLAMIRCGQGLLSEALEWMRKATLSGPDIARFHGNYAEMLRRSGDGEGAEREFRKALELDPKQPKVLSNLANLLQEMGRIDEAAECLCDALEMQPDTPQLHTHQGNLRLKQGRVEEAISCFENALAIERGDLHAHGNLCRAAQFSDRVDAEKMADILAAWQRCHVPTHRQASLPSTSPAKRGRLRVGYVSADFREHVVGRHFLWPMFEHADASRFEIFAYANQSGSDGLTEAFRAKADHWRVIAGGSDEQVVDQIRRDGVDVLVDCSQHTAGNRLGVFARRAAPVQVAFAGCPSGSGLGEMDYRFSSEVLEPRDGWERGWEQAWMLPCAWHYDPTLAAVDGVGPLPALQNGFVTFVAMHGFYKISPTILQAWAEVMRRVPRSRILLSAEPGKHVGCMIEKFVDLGIDATRVEVALRRDHLAYMHRYRACDIALDSYPYNGHITTLDALWMGVPVVSLGGKRAVARAGADQLRHCGLDDLVADNPREFVDITVRLAGDLPRMAGLRAGLRERMQASPLLDTQSFVRSVERAYQEMWECGIL